MNLGLDGRCWGRRRGVENVRMGIQECGRICRSREADECGGPWNRGQGQCGGLKGQLGSFGCCRPRWWNDVALAAGARVLRAHG